jgi:ankyrin repeat protein
LISSFNFLIFVCSEAAYYGHLSVVKWLIDEAKSDYTQRDKEGRSILYFAVRSGRLEIVEYLLAKNTLLPKVLFFPPLLSPIWSTLVA